jgi:hypothetical protein
MNLMKKNILTAILFLLLNQIVLSQDAKFFDAPFGGGGGYTPAWYIPNLDQLNEKLVLNNIPEFSGSGFYASGGAGFIYIGFVKNLRLGGYGYSGSTAQSAFDAGFNKEVVYTLGGGALTVEYTLPIVKDIGVSIGTAIGAGSLTIDYYKNIGSEDWNSIWSGTSTTGSEYKNMKNNFWFISPTINIDFPVYRFFVLRVGAGYQLTFGDSWEIDNGRELINVPSKLNGNSFFIQTGLFLGFFSF